MKFKDIVATRDKDFMDTIYSFGTVEGEVYAYTRWLRARKYVLEDTLKMVEEATACRMAPKMDNFYPDPNEALGCDTSTYLSQYPQLYSGFAKNGAPLFISKPGALNVDAVECCTTLPNILKYHWHSMVHDFGSRLREFKEKDPKFTNFQCVCILDLEHLTMSKLSKRTLEIIKEQSFIDSLCFPETMNKMYVVNAPTFFSATWKIIKGYLDPRTSGKIEVISSKKVWIPKVLESVGPEDLPCDYGGIGPKTDLTIEKVNYSGSLARVHSEVMFLRGHGSASHAIQAGEELEISIYTKSQHGAKFSVTDASHTHEAWVNQLEVKHDGIPAGTEDSAHVMPKKVVITGNKISGPATIKVKADSNISRLSTHNFLVVFSVYRK